MRERSACTRSAKALKWVGSGKWSRSRESESSTITKERKVRSKIIMMMDGCLYVSAHCDVERERESRLRLTVGIGQAGLPASTI